MERSDYGATEPTATKPAGKILSLDDMWKLWQEILQKGAHQMTAIEEMRRLFKETQNTVSRLEMMVENINTRFKPVVFIPRELNHLKLDKAQEWPTVARDDRPYVPGDGTHSPPRGFPIGWTPPKGTRITKTKGIIPPKVDENQLPDISWKPPGWREPGSTPPPDLKKATEKAKKK